MRAIFVRCQSILRDSHALADENPRLAPATLEAMREIVNDGVLIVVYGHFVHEQGAIPGIMQTIIAQIEAAAGRIDVAVSCPHDSETACQCWGDSPGIIWSTASQYGIDLAASYLIGDCVEDVLTAKAAGVRPILVLGERSIKDVIDDMDLEKDFGIAPDLPRAATFVAIEDEIATTVGGARQIAVELPGELAPAEDQDALPLVMPVSEAARQSHLRRSETRLQLSDITRWLLFITVGGLGLSLGIAYLLTHLYRVQAFPAYVGTLTLQFIPRPIRGAIFVTIGLLFVALALRSVIRAMRGQPSSATRKDRRRRGQQH